MISRYFHTAPATTLYLFSLAVTSLVVRTSSTRLVNRLLRQESTNLFNMGHHPGKVLLVSAFLIESGSVLPWLIGFALVLAPAERWLGSIRWLLLFAAGHIGATLLTLLGIWHITHGGRTDLALVHSVDVGVSYGFYAVAAALSYRFPLRWRLIFTAALLTNLAIVAATTREFTDVGHLCAVLIGLAAYPLVRARMYPTEETERSDVAVGDLTGTRAALRWRAESSAVALWAALLLVSAPFAAIAVDLVSRNVDAGPGVAVVVITVVSVFMIGLRDRHGVRAASAGGSSAG